MIQINSWKSYIIKWLFFDFVIVSYCINNKSLFDLNHKENSSFGIVLEKETAEPIMSTLSEPIDKPFLIKSSAVLGNMTFFGSSSFCSTKRLIFSHAQLKFFYSTVVSSSIYGSIKG